MRPVQCWGLVGNDIVMIPDENTIARSEVEKPGDNARRKHGDRGNRWFLNGVQRSARFVLLLNGAIWGWKARVDCVKVSATGVKGATVCYQRGCAFTSASEPPRPMTFSNTSYHSYGVHDRSCERGITE